MKDDLGDRMKMYERQETTRQFLPNIPVCARIDGRSFSSFTKNMERPYDHDFLSAMEFTTDDLMRETGAVVGYTQSDEITLIFYTPGDRSQIIFDGKLYKLNSVLASIATVWFYAHAETYWPSICARMKPVFDCRVFQVPNLSEATNLVLWRENDARRNAVSMLARHYFSHRELQHKSVKQMKELLLKKGIDFEAECMRFKRGALFTKRLNNSETRKETVHMTRLNGYTTLIDCETHEDRMKLLFRDFIE